MTDEDQSREGWSPDAATSDQEPPDAFGAALARAAERRATGTPPADDPWLSDTSADMATEPVARRGVRAATDDPASVAEAGWLSSGDPVDDGDDPAPKAGERRRGRGPVEGVADEGWTAATGSVANTTDGDPIADDDHSALKSGDRWRGRRAVEAVADDGWTEAADATDGDPVADGEGPASTPGARRRGRRPVEGVADEGWSAATDAAGAADGETIADGEPALKPGERRRGRRPVEAAADDGWTTATDSAANTTGGDAVADGEGPAPMAGERRRGRRPAEAAEPGWPSAGEPAAEVAEAPIRHRGRGSGSVPPPESGRRRNTGPAAEGETGSAAEGEDSGPGQESRRDRRESGRRSDRRSKREPEPPADPVAKAKDICLTLLTSRARSRSELAQSLQRKGFEPDVIDQVLGRLNDVGLIDDAAFADAWVHSRHTYQGLGRRALKAELHRKGVPDEVVAEAVASVDRDAEEQRARELVRKKLRSMSAVDETAKIRRLLGMLARKGYSQGLSYAVIKEELRTDLDLSE